MSIANIFLLITFVINVALAMLIIAQAKGKNIKIFYALVTLSIAAWALAMIFFREAENAPSIFLWGRIVYFSAAFTPLFFILFSFYFPDDERSVPWYYMVILTLFTFFIAAFSLLSNYILESAQSTQGVNILNYGEGNVVYGLYISSYYVIGIATLLRKRRKYVRAVSSQITYILLGTGITLIIGFFNNFILTYQGIFNFNWLGPVSTLIMVGFIAYAITRYRLMDIKIVLRTSFVYGFSIALVLLLAFATRETLNAIFILPVALADALALLIAIAVYDRIKRFIFNFANKYFFTSLYDSKGVIRDLSDSIGSTIEAETIYKIIGNTLHDTLHPKHFAVLLSDQNDKRHLLVQYSEHDAFSKKLRVTKNTMSLFRKNPYPLVTEELERQESKRYAPAARELRRLGIAVAIPLKSKDNFLGVITLGPKEAGDMYTQEDLELLRIIGRQAAIAIDNGLLYDEVKRFNEELQARVERATADLRKRTKDLEIANEQLRKLDEAKSEFISIASHQLRTPLTAIKGYGSMLLDGDFGKVSEQKQYDAIERMVISNNRLITLVENLLNVSRIESGRIKFSMKEMQVEDLAKEVCDTLENSAKKQNLYLKYDMPDTPLPTVMADQEKVRQVLINFIDNAIKYTRTGGITVKVAVHDEMVRCCVQDTGMGINSEDKRKLFKKFSRGKDAFTVNTEGSGLGLYVAQMMIEGHNGNIWVESEGEGKGSSFCFELPVADSTAAKAAQAAAAREPKKAAGK